MIAIFDIDGVLADDSLTKHFDCGDPSEMAEFARLVHKLLPVQKSVRKARRLAAQGRVYLFTARSAAIRMATQNWLIDHEVPHEDLLMRPFGNGDAPEVLKEKMLDEVLQNTGADVSEVVAYDDDPRVIDMYHRRGVSCVLVRRDV